MTERPKVEKRTKAEGLTLEELERQVGALLPDRIEMRHRRRRRCRGLINICFVDVL